MKPVKLFYLKSCPFCRHALDCLEMMKADNKAYRNIEIEMIEESEHPEIADTYDYYYVPTFYVGDEKVHEGRADCPELEIVFKKALEE